MSRQNDDGGDDVSTETIPAYRSEDQLRQLVEIVEVARSVPMSSTVMVHREEVLDILDDVLAHLPDELRAARWLLKEREEFLAKAKRNMDEDKLPFPPSALKFMKAMGISDPSRVYDTNELAPGKKIIFAACGVTDGTLMRGVRFFGHGKRTHSLIMTTETKHVRFVDTVHVEGGPDAFVRFDR